MANQVITRGFQPTGVMYGVQDFAVDSSNSTAVFDGDVMDMEDDGNVSPAAAASVQIIGSAVGARTADYAAKSLLAASTAGNILCTWHKMQEYLCQLDADGATVGAQTLIGTNGDHIAGAGSTVTGWSGHELDASTLGGTDSDGFRLLDFVLDPLNEEDAVRAKCRVFCNEHFSTTTSGI